MGVLLYLFCNIYIYINQLLVVYFHIIEAKGIFLNRGEGKMCKAMLQDNSKNVVFFSKQIKTKGVNFQVVIALFPFLSSLNIYGASCHFW